MTTKMRDPKGGLELDEIREPTFDSIDIDSATAIPGSRNYFTNTQTKSEQQTNMVQPSQFAGGVSFRCLGIGFDMQTIYPSVRKMIPLFIEHSRLKFVVAEKNYYFANLAYVAGRVESQLAVATGTAATTEVDVFQKAGDSFLLQAVFEGKHARNIPELTNFSVNILTDGLSAAELAVMTPGANEVIRTIVSLKGLKRRPVQ